MKKMEKPCLTKFKARLAGKIEEKTAKEKAEAEAPGRAVCALRLVVRGNFWRTYVCVCVQSHSTCERDSEGADGWGEDGDAGSDQLQGAFGGKD